MSHVLRILLNFGTIAKVETCIILKRMKGQTISIFMFLLLFRV